MHPVTVICNSIFLRPLNNTKNSPIQLAYLVRNCSRLQDTASDPRGTVWSWQTRHLEWRSRICYDPNSGHPSVRWRQPRIPRDRSPASRIGWVSFDRSEHELWESLDQQDRRRWRPPSHRKTRRLWRILKQRPRIHVSIHAFWINTITVAVSSIVANGKWN